MKRLIHPNPWWVTGIFIFSVIVFMSGISVDTKPDGVNLVPYVTHQKTSHSHEVFFWRSGYSKAFRKGDWKLFINERNQKVRLFDLSKDRSETTDLSKAYPQKLAELLKDLQSWEKTN